MGKLWLGEYPDRGDAIVAFEDGEVQMGTSMSTFSSTVAVYGDGEIFVGPAHGFTPDATYDDGKIYVGCSAKWTPDAVYENGRVWLGEYMHGSPAACYEGDDDGAAAAAFIVLLHGATEDEESDEATASESITTGSSYSEGASYAPSNTVASGSSSGSGCGILVIIVGLFMATLVLSQLTRSTVPRVGYQGPPSAQASERSYRDYVGVPDPSSAQPFREVEPENNSLYLERVVTVSENQELLVDGVAATPPLSFRSFQAPQRVELSSPSPYGRYRVVSLCFEEECGETYLFDLEDQTLTYVYFSEQGVAHGLVWSPKEKFMVTPVTSGPALGFVFFDLATKKVVGKQENVIPAVLAAEEGDIGKPGAGITPNPPILKPLLESVTWTTDALAHMSCEVYKIRWKQSSADAWYGEVVQDGHVQVLLIIPTQDVGMVSRTRLVSLSH